MCVTVSVCPFVNISSSRYVTATLYVSISVCSYVTFTWYVNISVFVAVSGGFCEKCSAANLYHAMFPELFAPSTARLRNEVNPRKYPVFVLLHYLSASFIHFQSYVMILPICQI
jgi:hypothetical protein